MSCWKYALLAFGLVMWAYTFEAHAQRAQPGLVRLEPAPKVADTHYVEWVPRNVDPAQPLPMVIALHAMGAGPVGAVRAFEQGFSCPVRLIAPRGWIHDYGPGYSWFRSHAEDREPARFKAGIEEAVARLRVFAREIVETRPTTGRPIVTGFSQGGHVAYGLALQPEARFSLAIPVSGQLPESMWRPDIRRTVPVVAFHGERDGVVDFEVTQSMFRWAQQRLLPWKLRTDKRSGHRFSAAMRRGVAKTVRRHLVGRGQCSESGASPRSKGPV